MWIECNDGSFINSRFVSRIFIRERGSEWKCPYVLSADLGKEGLYDIDYYENEEDAEENLRFVIEHLNDNII